MLSQILVTCWQRFYAVPYSIYYTSYYNEPESGERESGEHRRRTNVKKIGVSSFIAPYPKRRYLKIY